MRALWPARSTALSRPRYRWPAPSGLATAGIVALFVAGLLPLLRVGAADLGLVGVLSPDEELAGRLVRHMVDARSLSPDHFFAYGALSRELAVLLLLPLTPFGAPSDRAVIVSLRLVSLLGGAATVVLTGLLGRRLGGPRTGAVAALLAAVTPDLAHWSAVAHPDTVQVALIAATLLVAGQLLERPSNRLVLLGGALAGLAFGTKYGGLPLMPVLLLASWGGHARTGPAPRVRQLAADALRVGAAFALAFLITNPYTLAEPVRFLGQFRGEIAHARDGHVFVEGDGRWEWLRVLASEDLGGPILLVSAVAGACIATGRAWRRPGGWAARVDLPLLLALWWTGWIGYLVLAVGYGAPRHALPALPAACALAAWVITMLARRALSGWKPAGTAVVLVAAAVIVASVLSSAKDVRARYRAGVALDTDPRVLAGRWVDATAPRDAGILRDAYVYLPPDRADAPVTYGLTEAELARVAPTFVIVNEDIRARFRWDVGAERYVDGREAYYGRMAAYAKLEAGELPCFVLLRDFGTVQVYGRRAEGSCAG